MNATSERRAGGRLGAATLLGATVTRPVYLDDGTWQQRGDECLPGPQRLGTVIKDEGRTIVVRWDDEWVAYGMKQEQTLLRHGADIAPNAALCDGSGQ